jgi:cysteine desulfurase/selenocysteine lyase
VVSFTIEGVHPHDVATIADSFGVAIRAGHHCAQILTRRLGQSATSRASFYVYNVPEEIEALAEALEHVLEVFRRGDSRAAVR